MTKLIYKFGGPDAEGGADDVAVLGGKGAHLAEMSRLGLPVPPGITIATKACEDVLSSGGGIEGNLADSLWRSVEELQERTGRVFGGSERPLVLSVRSGARVSMPGMMDSILNVGLTDTTVEALGGEVGDMRFAFDSYRRLIQMYGDVVMGVEIEDFEDALDELKSSMGVRDDADVTADGWRSVVETYKRIVLERTGREFPQDARAHLKESIDAVYRSWSNKRAVAYRRINGIPDTWGTAVNIQTMVFGNRDAQSATGVVFTRNPSTGAKHLFGEYLLNAQGEDVVAGIRTPMPLSSAGGMVRRSSGTPMEVALPRIYEELSDICTTLETHYRDVQDIEFTVEQGRLWILQTRTAKRTEKASVRIAAEMAHEGLISKEEAVARVDPEVLARDPHPMVDPSATIAHFGSGLPASPGAAWGKVVFYAEDAVEAAGADGNVILVRIETSPEDIEGMHAAAGVLTTRGGMTSHAAVVARGIGKPCVVGASAIQIDLRNNRLVADGAVFEEGDVITIDGSTGRIFAGQAPTVMPAIAEDFATLRRWSDSLASYRTEQADQNEEIDEGTARKP